MSAADNKQFIRGFVEALSGKPKPAAKLDLYMSDTALKERILWAESVFPHYRLEIDDLLAEDDQVWLRGRVRGKQLGPFQEMPPSGKPVEYAIVLTYRVAEGKIVDHWLLSDGLVLMQQLGALPAPANA